MNSNADLAGAIEALSKALAAMEQRQSELAAQVSAARQQRRGRLDERVTDLLPELSDDALERLKKEVPAFVKDRKLDEYFDQHGNFLWVFKSDSHDSALAVLQTQLKQFLEGQGLAGEDDSAIAKLEAEKSAVTTRQAEAMETLGLLRKALGAAGPLPDSAASAINKLAQLGRNPPALPANTLAAGAGGISSYRVAGGSTESDSDLDLWIWTVTDIPTSLRTSMMELFSHRHHGNQSSKPAAETAQGDVAYPGSGTTAESISGGRPVTSHGSLEGLGPDAAASDGTGNEELGAEDDGTGEVATDDSLGAFS